MKSTAERNGCFGTTELIMRFTLWAGDGLPLPREILERWGVDRATAYRWHDSLRAARGLPPLSQAVQRIDFEHTLARAKRAVDRAKKKCA